VHENSCILELLAEIMHTFLGKLLADETNHLGLQKTKIISNLSIVKHKTNRRTHYEVTSGCYASS